MSVQKSKSSEPSTNSVLQRIASISKAIRPGKPLDVAEIAQREASPNLESLLWNPRGSGVNDGITFSMLNKFLECRRRFGLQVFAGVQEKQGFNAPLEFGNLWHLAEEYAMKPADWKGPTYAYHRKLRKQFPTEISKVDQCMFGFACQFPIYLEHFKEIHDDLDKRVPIMEEYAFNVRFEVWGDYVQLRGKLDLVYAIKAKDGTHIVYIQENKTKGDIDQTAIPATLFANLQTMIYSNAVLTLMREQPHLFPKDSVFGGVIFNVVRRPGSGKPPTGPRRKAGQSDREYWRLMSDDIAKRPKFYFLRWKTVLSSDDISWFNDNTLYPILYQLLTWFDWRTGNHNFSPEEARIAASLDFQYPWGMWSALGQGFRGSYFEFLTRNITNNLEYVSNFFPELTPEG